MDNQLDRLDDIQITASDDRPHLSPLERHIIDAGWRMNENGQPFSFRDFVGVCSHGSFRNAILHINRKTNPPLVVHVYTSVIGFYAIRGSGVDSRSMTPVHSVGPAQKTLAEILAILGNQVTGVHNIHLDFLCPALYSIVDVIPDPHSLDKALLPVIFSKGRKARVVVHRTGSVSVKVACSDEPFPRENLAELLMVLEEIWGKLVATYNLAKEIPLPREWVVKRWEVNKDGREIDGPDISMTLSSFSGLLMRFYRKERDWIRVEKMEEVGKKLHELIQETLS